MIKFIKDIFKEGFITGLLNLGVFIIIGAIALYFFILQWELLFSIPPLKWIVDIIQWIISQFS